MNSLATSVSHSTPGSSGRFLNKKSVKMRIQIILYLPLPGSIVLPIANKCSAIELGKKFERGGGGQLGQAKPTGVQLENSKKIFIPETTANYASNFKN